MYVYLYSHLVQPADRDRDLEEEDELLEDPEDDEELDDEDDDLFKSYKIKVIYIITISSIDTYREYLLLLFLPPLLLLDLDLLTTLSLLNIKILLYR